MTDHSVLNVPFVNLKSQFAIDEDELVGIFREVGNSGNFILGDGVNKFEKNLAKYCDTGFAVGVGNGSDSLFFIMKALGIGPGDEVITQPNSFIATAWTIIATGATPIFVDVDETHSIDSSQIEDAITPRTKAIIPVHLAGNPCNMEAIMQISEKYGLYVVEDAAQAIGATYAGKPVGGFGIAGSFSLHPLKNLGVLGDGGVITTSDPLLSDQLRLLRNHGLRDRDRVEIWGYNSRLDELQARIADFRLSKLDSANERVRAIAKMYDEELKDVVGVPKITKNATHVYHNYMITTPSRDELANYLKSQDVDTRTHYPIPIHKQLAAKNLKDFGKSFPRAEAHANFSLSLPIYPSLSDSQVEKVIYCINLFFKKGL
jgi:dTDP-4-amino-4,6-dideoxygalactose transaminase